VEHVLPGLPTTWRKCHRASQVRIARENIPSFVLESRCSRIKPVSDFYYPIVNDLDRVVVAGSKDYDPIQHDLVGILSAPFYWRAMIRENLPPDSKGIVIVISSPCNQPFSYQINGPNTVYLGVGDWHDNTYESLNYHHTLCGNKNCSGAFSMYSGAPLETDTCPFTLTLYPSDAMKSEFTTKNPVIFSIVAVSIFLFTSLVFILYDYFVERRQRVVLGTATRSSAIVSSLFPTVVRDQLYPTSSTRADAKKERVQSILGAATDNAQSSEYQKLVGAPIAEMYPDTTVFFADIAGFTSWSSTRSPTDVFHLLETLYGGFDEIAHRHGVFKVETIGDSYVAVVGLPTPRKHHAVVMARFAQECILRMNTLMQDLAKVLGSVSTMNVGYVCCRYWRSLSYTFATLKGH
jgi:Adenylate and Guanylate cyclase catalytic domain